MSYRMTQDNIKGIIAHHLNYNPGAISLPILGFHIGDGHTAFAGDRVWSDSMIWEKGLTIQCWADGPGVPRNQRHLLCEENDCFHRPETLFPSLMLAAMSARKRINRLYRSRRKWMKTYRSGVQEMDEIIRAQKLKAKSLNENAAG